MKLKNAPARKFARRIAALAKLRVQIATDVSAPGHLKKARAVALASLERATATSHAVQRAIHTKKDRSSGSRLRAA